MNFNKSKMTIRCKVKNKQSSGDVPTGQRRQGKDENRKQTGAKPEQQTQSKGLVQSGALGQTERILQDECEYWESLYTVSVVVQMIEKSKLLTFEILLKVC